jgi:hypothetical protein
MRTTLICLAALLIASSAAQAKSKHVVVHHHHYHHRAVDAYAMVPMIPTMGPINPADHAAYVKALRESGFNPKNDYQKNGLIQEHLP